MPGTVICLDCQISGGSTSGVFFTLSGAASTSTAASPTATGSNTDGGTSHRGAHGPLRGSGFLSDPLPGSFTPTASHASSTTFRPVISFPGGPIANITTAGTSSESSISSSSSASPTLSASTNGSAGTKIAVIVLVTGGAAIVTAILLLLWLVSIRRRYRRSWVRIAEAEAKSSSHPPDRSGPQAASERASSVPSDPGAAVARVPSVRRESLASPIEPAGPTPEPAAPGSGSNATLPLAKRSREDLPQGEAPEISMAVDNVSDGVGSALRPRHESENGTGGQSMAGTPSQDNRLGHSRPDSNTTVFTSPPPPYSQLSE
ncbi:hypothetical protein C8T65DRAFT_654515 [Cerioporus squamosus]|nr:hypothetical protein C8T65DRAFT_654515 [Cerioporus squamosus]